ncbi:MAG: hypothetical protein K1X68_06915 [Saprospiraceae bacterium]|nr:hypothetical protein [Saprospiraceae bacterium]
MKLPRSRKAVLEMYHRNIFHLAYPRDRSEQLTAARALDEFRKLYLLAGEELRERMPALGLPGTIAYGFFSWKVLHELVRGGVHGLFIDGADEEGVHPREMLIHFLPAAEYESLGSGDKDAVTFLKQISGISSDDLLLKWLLVLFSRSPMPAKIKDSLFDRMKLVIGFDAGKNNISRENVRLNFAPVYFHEDGLLKKFDPDKIISAPLDPPWKLSPEMIKKILKVSRLALLMICRETDPITYCNGKQIRFYSLDRGFSIALFGLDQDHRLPLESYVGYMMFKNGMPVSYGGSWIFGRRALIGINIFDAYRGGESSYLFCQLMRAYAHCFQLDYFEVEPYQFGFNNPEGIKSGAFWFYYRLGYKTQDEKLRQLAAIEFSKIQKRRAYRSSEKTLKILSGSYLELKLHSQTQMLYPEAAVLSRRTTEAIQMQFGGDREAAFSWACNKLENELSGHLSYSQIRSSMHHLGLTFALLLNWDRCTAQDKTRIAMVLELKSSEDLRCGEVLAGVPLENLIS